MFISKAHFCQLQFVDFNYDFIPINFGWRKFWNHGRKYGKKDNPKNKDLIFKTDAILKKSIHRKGECHGYPEKSEKYDNS